jgi:hypothetical protein
VLLYRRRNGFPPVLADAALPVPASLAGLLSVFRPLFTALSFPAFCGLACGFLTQMGRRTVWGCRLGRPCRGAGAMTGALVLLPGRLGPRRPGPGGGPAGGGAAGARRGFMTGPRRGQACGPDHDFIPLTVHEICKLHAVCRQPGHPSARYGHDSGPGMQWFCHRLDDSHPRMSLATACQPGSWRIQWPCPA